MTETQFDYNLAFSRNLGWVTPEEQENLRKVKIAIPGLGGVGGHHLHNFLRLGVEKFHIADLDTFELPNFNRQLGATFQSIGRSKTEAMEEFAYNINPNCQIQLFSDGVQLNNIRQFLEGVDLLVDTLDLYAMPTRIALYKISHELRIPMVTAGPFGMGTSVMAFHPDRLGFTDYFNLNDPDLSIEEAIARFLVGITPPFFIKKGAYLVWKEGFDLWQKKLPSLNIGCDAAAAALGSVALKILLKR
ncbi:MAG: ThiF family adenylyltransferase, partial [Bdellovibrionales bacterium]|nr:ThiF family adenylyltransferase [Bdellovibrionales bacterium]